MPFNIETLPLVRGLPTIAFQPLLSEQFASSTVETAASRQYNIKKCQFEKRVKATARYQHQRRQLFGGRTQRKRRDSGSDMGEEAISRRLNRNKYSSLSSPLDNCPVSVVGVSDTRAENVQRTAVAQENAPYSSKFDAMIQLLEKFSFSEIKISQVCRIHKTQKESSSSSPVIQGLSTAKALRAREQACVYGAPDSTQVIHFDANIDEPPSVTNFPQKWLYEGNHVLHHSNQEYVIEKLFDWVEQHPERLGKDADPKDGNNTVRDWSWHSGTLLFSLCQIGKITFEFGKANWYRPVLGEMVQALSNAARAIGMRK